MKYICYLSLITFSIISIPSAAQKIKIPVVPHDWNWVVKPTSYKVTSDNSVEIEAAKGTDQYIAIDGSYESNSAPKLLFTPDKDFIFSAKLSTTFDTLYDAGAIVLYYDAGNYAKLLFEKADATKIMVTSSVITQKITDDSYHIDLPGKEVYLKVATSGKTCCFYYSLDGKQWNIVRTFALKQRTNLRLGFYAQSPYGPSCTVTYSDIQYTAKPFKDFATGE